MSSDVPRILFQVMARALGCGAPKRVSESRKLMPVNWWNRFRCGKPRHEGDLELAQGADRCSTRTINNHAPRYGIGRRRCADTQKAKPKGAKSDRFTAQRVGRLGFENRYFSTRSPHVQKLCSMWANHKLETQRARLPVKAIFPTQVP